MAKKLFSIDEVNELIPQLEHHFQNLLLHKKEMSKAAVRLRRMGLEPNLLESEPPSSADPELIELHRGLREHYEAFKQSLLSIERTGGEIKDLELGRVEFPAVENGSEIRLTWQLGVTEVAHRDAAEEVTPTFFEFHKIRKAG
ncbi:MAG TPA: DUF2203 family protein [bacterium]|nr:DUF2203 family protein [bacterium]